MRVPLLKRPDQMQTSENLVYHHPSPPYHNHYLLESWAPAALADPLALPLVFSCALVMASDTGVIAAGGAGVLDREGAALRLCAM